MQLNLRLLELDIAIFFLNETDGASGNDPKNGGDDPVVPVPPKK